MSGKTALYCVFDTNLYRGLSPEGVLGIAQAEAAQGVTAIASLWPCLELLAHCADRADDDYSIAHASLRRLWQHAGYDANGTPRLRVFEDGETQIARGLFGRVAGRRLQEIADTAELVGFIATHENQVVTSEIEGRLRTIASRVADRERGFEASLHSFTEMIAGAEGEHADRSQRGEVRRDFRETLRSPEGLLLIAETRVTESARQMGVTLTPPELKEFAHEVLTGYPSAIYFLRDLFIDLLSSHANSSHSSHRNSAWDLQIAFHASRVASIQGVPVLLVTDDKRIARAALGAGAAPFVRKLKEYERLLGSGELKGYGKSLTRE